MQYFLGLRELQQKPLFDPSMRVHFRSRFSEEHHALINSKIIEAATGGETDGSGLGGLEVITTQVSRLTASLDETFEQCAFAPCRRSPET